MRLKLKDMTLSQKVAVITMCILVPIWAIPICMYAVYRGFKEGF